MFNLLKKRLRNEKGLTLVELLAVIVILAIVAAIAVPAIGNIIENSRVKAAKADIANVVSAANLYFTEYNTANEFKVVKTETENNKSTPNAAQFVTNLGTISEITVTKNNGNITFKVSGTIAGNKSYTVDEGTDLEKLQVEKGNISGDGFKLEGKD
ncbi:MULTISPECIES: type II secretion system protein [Ureibacillus]|jgi:type IV pilus assembly protein PilA|uniref:type II secretion system protein n=1 Tax=Ureibacillus TaxID=160795 RepID=UPI0003082541|nr:prepilin-type N-terminal cleavage/methylation domain-containing protein [Ureibacillus thermosphaericus]